MWAVYHFSSVFEHSDSFLQSKQLDFGGGNGILDENRSPVFWVFSVCIYIQLVTEGTLYCVFFFFDVFHLAKNQPFEFWVLNIWGIIALRDRV